MDDDAPRRTELRQFLMSRRRSLSPIDVGLPVGTRRLAKGLRREEVATLAGVGLTWYTWLEQGRPINPSPDLLRRLGRALKLAPADQVYLLKIAGLRRTSVPASGIEIGPALTKLLATYPAPALLIDELFNLLACNGLATFLYGIDTTSTEKFARNQLWQIFMNRSRRGLYPRFADDVPKIVALFRVTAAAHINEPGYEELVSALISQSPDFADMWRDLDAATAKPITLQLRHAAMGDLNVHSVRLPIDGDPMMMLVFVVPADEPTRLAFTRNASQRVDVLEPRSSE